MKGAITKNFRGLRALVIHAEDANRQMLVGVLGRLGLDVRTIDPQDAVLPDALAGSDIVLADMVTEGLPPRAAPDALPCIALIGSEAPSQLARVVAQGCASHIMKPIRSSGVFTALLLAVNEHDRRRKADREIHSLRQRMAGRRIVTRAVLNLMLAHGLNHDDAYERLRLAAMNRRLPIDELAREHLALTPHAAEPSAHPWVPADDRPDTPAPNRRMTR
ncbi:ANTAR domain-containing protein (plasmid) [Paracoccus liaowanqingii]|uniref:ANTAR domain-containing protein n=1 Tax=Paracoccus liaowanqingii TaxID=2560053 RepID=A0A4Y5SSG4_9RHOB|nr:ANTAR domain-containing protein [Paracoccus liaowanqingii]QDA36411.1 ANTAR domain-containing protein [Paracoccus liaowanqingii]